jgi:phosphatidylserine/phosphatidylglycerophosphate/cardiolipin synthase-like enzyme
MAKFLNTRKAISEIEDLIRNAGQTLTLISPYLKLSKDFKELLTFRNNKDKVTTIIFGKQELNPDEMKFLQSLRFVVLKYNEDLHAKCYMNDEKMVITSLNLYQFSMANNKEMGVLITKLDASDEQVFAEASAEIEFINQTSTRFEFGIPKINKPVDVVPRKATENRQMGYCIRTRTEIPFNVEKPMSAKAFESWIQFGKEDYPEKFCHYSGEQSNGETSYSKPILKKYWNKAKTLVQ